jgi:hypothetical protein
MKSSNVEAKMNKPDDISTSLSITGPEGHGCCTPSIMRLFWLKIVENQARRNV